MSRLGRKWALQRFSTCCWALHKLLITNAPLLWQFLFDCWIELGIDLNSCHQLQITWTVISSIRINIEMKKENCNRSNWKWKFSSVINYALPIMLTLEPRQVIIFWAHSPIMSQHYKPWHIPFNCRCSLKRNDHTRLTSHTNLDYYSKNVLEPRRVKV